MAAQRPRAESGSGRSGQLPGPRAAEGLQGIKIGLCPSVLVRQRSPVTLMEPVQGMGGGRCPGGAGGGDGPVGSRLEEICGRGRERGMA